jgi:hypothetical protein
MYLMTLRSYRENAAQVRRHILEPQRTMESNVIELEQRYPDWFNPQNNHSVILAGLGPVYRDFRAGDFSSPRFELPDTIETTLNKIAAFLWF